jgi:hypothetical protein
MGYERNEGMRRLVLVGLLAVTVGLLAAPALATDSNHVDFWCEVGVKFEPVDNPFIVPEPPDGYVWTLLVLKSGATAGQNETFVNPVVGDGYQHTLGENSHAILCKELIPDETTTTTTTVPEEETTTTTTTVPEEETTTTTVADTTTTVPDTTTSIPTGVPTGEPLQGSGALDRAVGIGAVVAALALGGAFARRKWLTR